MDYSHYERINTDRRGRILTLTLNRPETRNAVDQRMHDELATIFYDLQRDDQADVIVITGAGGDINWLAALRQADSSSHLVAVDAKKIVFGLLDLHVYNMAERLSTGATKAIRWTKTAVNIGLKQIAHSVMDASISYEMLTFATNDHREAVAAFQEKRNPTFHGT